MSDQNYYYAVIFTETSSGNDEGYSAMAKQMRALAEKQPGYLGFESFIGAENPAAAVAISYWQDLEAIKGWRANLEHQQAQQRGREQWLSSYRVRVARVERDYRWESGGHHEA